MHTVTMKLLVTLMCALTYVQATMYRYNLPMSTVETSQAMVMPSSSRIMASTPRVLNGQSTMSTQHMQSNAYIPQTQVKQLQDVHLPGKTTTFRSLNAPTQYISSSNGAFQQSQSPIVLPFVGSGNSLQFQNSAFNTFQNPLQYNTPSFTVNSAGLTGNSGLGDYSFNYNGMSTPYSSSVSALNSPNFHMSTQPSIVSAGVRNSQISLSNMPRRFSSAYLSQPSMSMYAGATEPRTFQTGIINQQMMAEPINYGANVAGYTSGSTNLNNFGVGNTLSLPSMSGYSSKVGSGYFSAPSMSIYARASAPRTFHTGIINQQMMAAPINYGANVAGYSQGSTQSIPSMSGYSSNIGSGYLSAPTPMISAESSGTSGVQLLSGQPWKAAQLNYGGAGISPQGYGNFQSAGVSGLPAGAGVSGMSYGTGVSEMSSGAGASGLPLGAFQVGPSVISESNAFHGSGSQTMGQGVQQFGGQIQQAMAGRSQQQFGGIVQGVIPQPFSY